MSFIPKASNRTTFCSRDCAFSSKTEAAIARKALTRPRPLPARSCSVCERTFDPSSPCQSICSQQCRLEKSREAGRLYQRRRRNSVPAVISCLHCGRSFAQSHGNNSAFCSRRCARSTEKRTRRARKLNAYVEPVSFAYIFRRDKGRCQLCGKRVEGRRDPLDPLSPTLDHIVPLSKGGSHEKANVQLAHRACNSAKGDRSMGEQLMMVG
jgi:5-methylcytosine-specific restriction endonuclease McrA